MQLEDVEMANRWQGERVLSKGRNFVAFQADFGDVLAGNQAIRMADDGIAEDEAKIKK